MALIFPFRGFRYNPAKVRPEQVVTQPYDKITAVMQEAYYSASPYNLVRIILGKGEPADRDGSNVYSRAAAYFRDWRQQQVLQQDAEPSIYCYVERFTAPGGSQQMERRGFIALGQLEDYAAQVVFRHEQTLAKPKADRLDLLRATRAHFGQIFMLYSDVDNAIDLALQECISGKAQPNIEVQDENGVQHKVWRISDAAAIKSVQAAMATKQLIIADGHHRYETALNYRNERRKAACTSAPEAAPPDYEIAMMTFVNMDAPGLVILPTHRVVHGLNGFSVDAFRAKACKHFSVEEVDPAVDAERARVILREAGRTGTALLAVTANRTFLLDRAKNSDTKLFADLSLRQQALDVIQLHRCVLEDVLGLSTESIRNQENIRYLRDGREAIQQVREGAANVAFLMNPVSIKQVRDIAFSGEVLPQKSTDFYPKLLSGLAIYALE
jgi:uncharacterized protein (DUF1015 family)